MPLYTKVGGVWRECTYGGLQQVKIGSTWHQLSNGYVKVDGVWRQFWTQYIPGTTTLVAPGTSGFIVPPGVTSLIASVYGAGGGAGACNSDGDAWVGGGGGAGGKYVNVAIPVTPGETLTLIVGKRGYGASYRFNSGYAYNTNDLGQTISIGTGTAGGASAIQRSGVDLLRANGGGQGSTYGAGIGGTPGGGNGTVVNANGYTGPAYGGTNGTGVAPLGHAASWNAGTGTGYGNGGGNSGLGVGCNGMPGTIILTW